MSIAKALLAASAAVVSAFALCEKKASAGSNKEEPNFLLILGCRVRGDEPEETLKTRIAAAAKYLSEHEKVVALCCGGIVHDDQTKSEAQAIFEVLSEKGIDEGRLILEDKSTTTEENFINAKKIIEAMELEKEPKIAFISSEFHLLRAGIIGKNAGVKATSIPAPSPKKSRLKNYARELVVFPFALKKRKDGRS